MADGETGGEVIKLYHGNCLEILPTLPENSVDSIVTDPPYELGFMGKGWDGSGIAFEVKVWIEALRVLKPGGHLLAFGGSRTYHRLACAVEDAGFEIRDQIMWIYGQGFPKSQNLDRLRGNDICGCQEKESPHYAETTQPQTERDLCFMRDSDVPPSLDLSQGGGEILQPSMPEQSASASRWEKLPFAEVWTREPSMEGRGHASTETRELCFSAVCSVSRVGEGDVSEGRIRDGASPDSCSAGGSLSHPLGNGSSHRPQPLEQRPPESGTVAHKQGPQVSGVWEICSRCRKPMVSSGLGTALKPAHEPIVVARKPLIGTVVANVLEYGTGALNIDGCRVGPGDPVSGGGNNFDAWRDGEDRTDRPKQHGSSSEGHNNGRWPANIIHDGSEEVLVHFPDALGQQGDLVNHDKDRKSPNGCFGKMAPAKDHVARGDSGTAARFFYCAKASKKDRGEGNKHPTVKPQALMRYLVRLVTPPKGVVLDPFAGSFSTGLAAKEEGFSFIGVEREEEYYEYGKKRMGETETMIDWLEELEVGTK